MPSRRLRHSAHGDVSVIGGRAYRGEGGPGHAVGEHLEEYVKGGGWEGTAPERRGEGAADEKVAWWGGVEG